MKLEYDSSATGDFMPDERQSDWFPEIMYEETEDGISSKIPFVLVPEREQMPPLLYVFESRETGEFEPGIDGNPVPILEMDLHQYADMAALKANLHQVEYDNVRFALGLDSLMQASQKGREVTNNIRKNIEEKTKPRP